MRGSPAIEAVDISKSFRLPHQARTTLKEHFLHPFARTTYEVQHALRNVSFEIRTGEFFGIVGPNGSGKSTLLKIAAGIYRPSSGTIRVNGALSPFIELGVGFHGELNARDNIRVNGTLMGLTRKEIDERFDEIMAFADLERFADQQLKNYSSGMYLRLAYSVAIQVPFDILLLDEVLAVGDAEFQKKCFATFDRFRDEGKTIVLVTHDLDVIGRFADRALLIRDGRVAHLGDPTSVIRRYREQVREPVLPSLAAS
jgi:ABC-type polysaccharide/polyol phosphate transport system ATPase subunit